MIKWMIGFLLLSYRSILAQPDVTSFSIIIQDDSLKKVLRQFIQIGQNQGLHKDGSFLTLDATNQGDPLQAQWRVWAINATMMKPEKLKEFIPAHVCEFEGYSILIYFTQQPTRFFSYPPAYLAYLSKIIDTKFQHRLSHQLLTTDEWTVTFARGNPTLISVER